LDDEQTISVAIIECEEESSLIDAIRIAVVNIYSGDREE
jgi:hypothetical protein